MKYSPDIHHRRSIRLKGYDYSQAGAYFVTLCAQNKECLFGEIVDGKMMLKEPGLIVEDCWGWLSKQYPHVILDTWVVMPNHLHAIIMITYDGRGGSRTAPTVMAIRKPLGRLIGAFKTVSTKRINVMRETPAVPVWQRNYYEHILRSEEELIRTSEYILNNPARWAEDENNPAVIGNANGHRVM
ncbi:MAG: transposase [Nitrospirae bacterium]|nr:transposase [Nitrospirota bacterium]